MYYTDYINYLKDENYMVDFPLGIDIEVLDKKTFLPICYIFFALDERSEKKSLITTIVAYDSFVDEKILLPIKEGLFLDTMPVNNISDKEGKIYSIPESENLTQTYIYSSNPLSANDCAELTILAHERVVDGFLFDNSDIVS